MNRGRGGSDGKTLHLGTFLQMSHILFLPLYWCLFIATVVGYLEFSFYVTRKLYWNFSVIF